MIMRLPLQRKPRRQQPPELPPQHPHPAALIRLPTQTRQQKMGMIRHHAIHRTSQTIPDTHMHQRLPQPRMKLCIQPPRRPTLHRHRPMPNRLTPIKFQIQPRQPLPTNHDFPVAEIRRIFDPKNHSALKIAPNRTKSRSGKSKIFRPLPAPQPSRPRKPFRLPLLATPQQAFR